METDCKSRYRGKYLVIDCLLSSGKIKNYNSWGPQEQPLGDHRNSINDCEECLCLAGAFCFRCRLKLRRDIWNLNGNCQFCLHQFSFSKLSLTHTKLLENFPGKKSHIFINRYHWNLNAGSKSEINVGFFLKLESKCIIVEQWAVYPNSLGSKDCDNKSGNIQFPWDARSLPDMNEQSPMADIFYYQCAFQGVALFEPPFYLKPRSQISKVIMVFSAQSDLSSLVSKMRSCLHFQRAQWASPNVFCNLGVKVKREVSRTAEGLEKPDNANHHWIDKEENSEIPFGCLGKLTVSIYSWKLINKLPSLTLSLLLREAPTEEVTGPPTTHTSPLQPTRAVFILTLSTQVYWCLMNYTVYIYFY